MSRWKKHLSTDLVDGEVSYHLLHQRSPNIVTVETKESLVQDPVTDSAEYPSALACYGSTGAVSSNSAFSLFTTKEDEEEKRGNISKNRSQCSCSPDQTPDRSGRGLLGSSANDQSPELLFFFSSDAPSWESLSCVFQAAKPKAASASEKENNPVRTPEALPEDKKLEYRLLREQIAR